MQKPTACLSDMPWNIKDKIFSKVDHITRLVLRKVSHKLQEDVDSSLSPTPYAQIGISLQENSATLLLVETFEKPLLIEYWRTEHRFCHVMDNIRVISGGVNHVERLVRDLATVFQNSRASIDVFALLKTDYASDPKHAEKFSRDKRSFLDTFKEVFGQLPSPIKVGGVNLGWSLSGEEMMQIISPMKSGELKAMRVKPSNDNDMKLLLESNYYEHFEGIYVRNIGLECMFHKQFLRDMRIIDSTATLDDLAKLLEILLSDQCDRVVFWNLTYDKGQFLAHLNEFYNLPPVQANQYAIKMTNSDDYIAIAVQDPHLYCFKVDMNFGLDTVAGRPFLLNDVDIYAE